MVVPSSVVVPEELELLLELELLDEPELLLELELLDEPELLPELALPLEELLEELPLLLPEELEPPLLPPPPPPQAVSIETAMTAARATAAILFDNLMIEFLLFLIQFQNKKPQMSLLCTLILPPPRPLCQGNPIILSVSAKIFILYGAT